MQLQSEKLYDYLKKTTIINYDDRSVAALSARIKQSAVSETELARRIFEFVRDGIAHSADIGGAIVTCRASDVLKTGEGICFAKSHLLAALCRANGIPAGFCYQKLRLTDDASPLILHGLNAIYLGEIRKWVRLDTRGNKPGINAQFSLDKELLAFPVREEVGETDYPTIFTDPDANVVDALTRFNTVEALWENLPRDLSEPARPPIKV